MSEENKALLQRWVEEGWNQKKAFDILEEVWSPDICIESDDVEYRGYDSIRQFVTTFLTAFPDLHNTVDILLADGDKVISRHTLTGTHTGDLMGIAPTGKQIKVTAIFIGRVADGKFVEGWQNANLLGLFQQLDAVPPMGEIK